MNFPIWKLMSLHCNREVKVDEKEGGNITAVENDFKVVRVLPVQKQERWVLLFFFLPESSLL